MPLALKILVARYGLDGAPPRSLEEVAVAFGLDRLRVRMIEGRALEALTVASATTPPDEEAP